MATATLNDGARPQWHVLWTRSNCEGLVRDQLAAGGFQPFLPTFETWTRRGGERRVARVPMFPGYLFLHDALDKAASLEVRKARGLVAILGDRWDRPAAVPEEEIEAVRRLAEAGQPALPHPYLREGQRVRITRGPLNGLEGLLMKARPERGLLVVSIHLLQRSVAVEVDCTEVVPA